MIALKDFDSNSKLRLFSYCLPLLRNKLNSSCKCERFYSYLSTSFYVPSYKLSKMSGKVHLLEDPACWSGNYHHVLNVGQKNHHVLDVGLENHHVLDEGHKAMDTVGGMIHFQY